VWKEGVALILEDGQKNNAEAEQHFYRIRKEHQLEGVLKSLSFVPKNNCRAIQTVFLLSIRDVTARPWKGP
jgi:hypothetical protein